MIPATIYKHIHLTASQRAEDRACPDGAPEVELCDCGEVATVKCGRERFCAKCNAEIDAEEKERLMSVVKHTAEPWTIGTYTNYSGAAIHAPDGSCVLERWEGLDGKPVATERAERMRADAARAIACVNALAGIPDPADFVKSHNRLLEALELAKQHCLNLYDGGNRDGFMGAAPMPEIIDAIENARKATP